MARPRTRVVPTRVELEAFLLDQKLSHPTQRHALTSALNLLLKHYEERYDFVHFFTDHPVPTSPVAGIFQAVTHHAAPGGVLDFDIAPSGYETSGRVKGVVGFPYTEGGRATMNTVLGPRRKVSDTPPAARAPFTCDVIAQDCPRPELTCTLGPPALCALPGAGQLNAACAGYPDCDRGLACVSGSASPDQFVCQPYCDLESTSAASACAKCAHSYLSYKDTAGKLSGVCLPN